jgi:hypothetical protein
MIVIYAFSIVSIYYVILMKYDQVVDHLFEQAKVELLKKARLFAHERAWIVQEPLNLNYKIHGYFNDVINSGKIFLSDSFSISEIMKNYAKYNEGDTFDKDFTIWYMSPNVTDYGTLFVHAILLYTHFLHLVLLLLLSFLA